MKRIKKVAIAGIIIAFSMSYGCAGRTPNPVREYQYGDNTKSCDHLRYEIADVDSDIKLKAGQKDTATGKNLLLGVGGAVLFWPALFFMDLSGADKVELEALVKRHNALLRTAADKSCGLDASIIEVKAEQPKTQVAPCWPDCNK